MKENFRWLVDRSPVGALAALYRNENPDTLTWEWSGNEHCRGCGSETVRIYGKTLWSAPTCLCERAGLGEFVRYINLIDNTLLTSWAALYPDVLVEIHKRILDVIDWLREEEIPEVKDVEKFAETVRAAAATRAAWAEEEKNEID